LRLGAQGAPRFLLHHRRRRRARVLAAEDRVSAVKHAPATPLPHRLRGNAKHGYIVGPKREHIDEIPFESWGDEAKALRQTWRYYIHAANSYPKLVEYVRGVGGPVGAALLRELGEDS
jgi:hypothetical protein